MFEKFIETIISLTTYDVYDIVIAQGVFLYERIISATIYDIIGALGVTLYLGSYYLLSKQKIQGDSLAYHVANFFAPVCVLISLYQDFNAPSFVIQFVWVFLSLSAITRLLKSTKDKLVR